MFDEKRKKIMLERIKNRIIVQIQNDLSGIDWFLPDWKERGISPATIRDCEKGKYD